MAVRIVRKNRKKFLFVLLIVILNLVAISLMGYSGYQHLKSQEKNYKDQINELKYSINANKKSLLVPIRDIKYNTILKEDMFVMTEITTSLPEEVYITKEDFGKLCALNLKAKIPVMKSMVEEQALVNDLREMEFNMLSLQTNLVQNDYVDIRIRFPNGEDYVVLSKKKVVDINLRQNTIWTWIDEKEIMTASSAIIDAYLNKGSKLYVTKYVQPKIQSELTTSYPFNEDVKNAMLKDPNILEKASVELMVEARKELDERLAMLTQEELSNVDTGVSKEENRSSQIKDDMATQEPPQNTGQDIPQQSPSEESQTDDFFN